MLRGALNALALVVLTLLGAVASICVGPFTRTGDVVLVLARIWSRSVLAVSGVRLTVEARATLDPRGPYLFMCNHLSMVDIWALLAVLPVKFRFIAKKQLGWIPLFGWAMQAGRFIFIDRQNPLRARATIQEAARRIASGTSVLLFPEGTRSRDGHLAPFKKGGFHLALDAAVPIVPLAIRGAHEIMPRGSPFIRPGRVRITIGEPMAIGKPDARDREALMQDVRGKIVAMLGEGAASGAPP